MRRAIDEDLLAPQNLQTNEDIDQGQRGGTSPTFSTGHRQLGQVIDFAWQEAKGLHYKADAACLCLRTSGAVILGGGCAGKVSCMPSSSILCSGSGCV